ncbi:MAG: MazG-like family protein [Alphaproteobacteria bacterium]|nr:MazG-like family protein [Alphaproteobacteria bacterium]
MKTLTFSALRRANKDRVGAFLNANGQPAYAKPDSSDWSIADWLVAVMGELGEAANVVKKVRRGDMTMDEARPLLEQEFADVVIYLDLIADQCGIDLGAGVAKTFDAKSVQLGLPHRIDWVGDRL